MIAKCPKCGWETRELTDDEIQWVKEGRLRCSGACQDAAVANQPSTFPAKLKLVEEEKDGSN